MAPVKTVFFVGDSLSVGILSAWKVVVDTYGESLHSAGSPVVGASLSAMMGQVPPVAFAGASAVHIMGGTNDAAGGVFPDLMFKRMQQLVDFCRSTAPSVPVVITPAPPSTKSWNSNLEAFNSRLGKIRGAVVGSQTITTDDLSSDGVHPQDYARYATFVGQNLKLVLPPSGSGGDGGSSLLMALGLGAAAAYAARKWL